MNFDMFMAGRISFGAGVSATVGEKAKALGASKVMLVTDETMVSIGTAERITSYLEEAGLSVETFSQVEPEPSVETVDLAADRLKATGCDLVVGLGGGSSMDVAKAVSVLATNEGSAGAYQGLGLVEKPGIPKITIPTTAGTGSEVTFTAVLIRKSDGVKGGINSDYLYPDCSLLDPELTLSMPKKVTTETGMDALAHALEAYTSRQASPFSDTMAEAAIARIGRYLRVAALNGNDIEARSEMMLAALFGGVALANAGVTACHSMAYPLGAVFGVGHGLSNALLLPYVVRFNAMAAPEKFARAAELLGGTNYSEGLFDRAVDCADRLDELVHDLDLPTNLRELEVGIAPENFEDMAKRAMAVARPMENNPRDITLEQVISIYEEAF
ncbi:iron-containing alcohol dehydrogenase [Dethiosulfovibrio peptidovorans DSM 11002]|uniref:Iron-containing alcohol dehydrogenase n=1 Tax=Dethiosulfovibrio peptidovorans DSM 11002 TaxID=469381 RepID=D2Z5W4_9BACT|nr:iron-containing alcohol dehydrogenase [Dethiosulfovibrio peptidovorans]EFC90861.1 iron-containing alcohol dehydrogenase [Dethiosulfovibrio peptidovorans DSM 11002]